MGRGLHDLSSQIFGYKGWVEGAQLIFLPDETLAVFNWPIALWEIALNV